MESLDAEWVEASGLAPMPADAGASAAAAPPSSSMSSMAPAATALVATGPFRAQALPSTAGSSWGLGDLRLPALPTLFDAAPPGPAAGGRDDTGAGSGGGGGNEGGGGGPRYASAAHGASPESKQTAPNAVLSSDVAEIRFVKNAWNPMNPADHPTMRCDYDTTLLCHIVFYNRDHMPLSLLYVAQQGEMIVVYGRSRTLTFLRVEPRLTLEDAKRLSSHEPELITEYVYRVVFRVPRDIPLPCEVYFHFLGVKPIVCKLVPNDKALRAMAMAAAASAASAAAAAQQQLLRGRGRAAALSGGGKRGPQGAGGGGGGMDPAVVLAAAQKAGAAGAPGWTPTPSVPAAIATAAAGLPGVGVMVHPQHAFPGLPFAGPFLPMPEGVPLIEYGAPANPTRRPRVYNCRTCTKANGGEPVVKKTCPCDKLKNRGPAGSAAERKLLNAERKKRSVVRAARTLAKAGDEGAIALAATISGGGGGGGGGKRGPRRIAADPAPLMLMPPAPEPGSDRKSTRGGGSGGSGGLEALASAVAGRPARPAAATAAAQLVAAVRKRRAAASDELRVTRSALASRARSTGLARPTAAAAAAAVGKDNVDPVASSDDDTAGSGSDTDASDGGDESGGSSSPSSSSPPPARPTQRSGRSGSAARRRAAPRRSDAGRSRKRARVAVRTVRRR